MRRGLVVILFSAFIIVMSIAIYWVFFRSDSTNLNGNDSFGGGQLPGIGSGNVSLINGNSNDALGDLFNVNEIIDDRVSEVADGGLTLVNRLSEGDVRGLESGFRGIQYYDSEKQQFFFIDNDGNIRTLSEKKFFEVESVSWSPTGEKAILEYPDGSNILYNFQTGKQITLPREMEDFSFNSSGSGIVSKWMGGNEDNNWLVASNDDGSGLFLIEPIGDQGHNVLTGYSPDGQIAALNRKYIDDQRQEIFPIGLEGENFRSFIVNGGGFESTWSPSGSSLLYSVYHENTNYTPNLWVTQGDTNSLGDTKVSLNLATWPDKCAFANEQTLYCAVPQGLPRGAGFYPEVALDYPDNIYAVDLRSGAKSLIASPVGEVGSYSAQNLFFSADGSTLYFTDANTGTLQSIRIK